MPTSKTEKMLRSKGRNRLENSNIHSNHKNVLQAEALQDTSSCYSYGNLKAFGYVFKMRISEGCEGIQCLYGV